MKYRCIIVDDEELARELIETHLKQFDQFRILATCKSAIEASKVLATQQVDLLFLDIEMPVLKGTDFLKSLNNVPKVIFTTAYRDYAIEGFELNAVDYLLKPIVFGRFFKAIQKFLESVQPMVSNVVETHPLKDYIYVQADRKNIKVELDHILFVESLKDYVKIHLAEGSLLTKNGITAFHEQLDSRFLRIHRSYLVNKNAVTAFTKQDIEIDGIELPIGDSYKEGVIAALH